MYKTDFLEFYNNVVKELGVRFETEYKQFHFCDNPNSLYEEYLNQKTILRVLYEKNDGEEKALLDRHKVCACMLTAIIKVRLVVEILRVMIASLYLWHPELTNSWLL